MRKTSVALKPRTLAVSSNVHLVLSFDSGFRSGAQQYVYKMDVHLRPDHVVVTYERAEIGEDAALPAVTRKVTLGGAWRDDIENIVAQTRLVERLHLVDGPVWRLRINNNEAPTSGKGRAAKPAPSMPSNLDDWAELGEALGVLVDERPSPPLRFVQVDGRQVWEVRIDHNVVRRSASMAYMRNGRVLQNVVLPMAQYKDMVAVLRRLRTAGATFPGNPPKKSGFYIDPGAGDLSAWSRDVVNPNGPRAEACVACLREVTHANRRPQDFPEWHPVE